MAMSKGKELGLVWLRRDLRLLDNKALNEGLKSCEQVAVVFVFDPKILDAIEDKDNLRVSFLFESLVELDGDLRKKGSRLIVKHGDPVTEVPNLLEALGADALFFNEDYEVYAKKRDQRVKDLVAEKGLAATSFKDHVVYSGSQVLKPDGGAYQVFTPYKKAWLKKLNKKDVELQKISGKFLEEGAIKAHSQDLSLEKIGFKPAAFHYSFQKPGRKSGVKSLVRFSEAIKNYEKHRDFPYLEGGTSGLSVHLRFGTISIRECVRMCMGFNSNGSRTWLSELIWRDFYSMILDQFPHVETECFKQQYNKLKWKTSPKLFEAWCNGMTGFPIVDAGMRQLNKTGWMHNRVRMITASFLVKDLLQNWQDGEAYFARKLLDYELASNNGGWQWSASTGCDAQPYFRIFNPSLQSKRFDPDAKYIKEWVPELKGCIPKDIHDPENSELFKQCEYPKPIVTHADQKPKALELFKKL